MLRGLLVSIREASTQKRSEGFLGRLRATGPVCSPEPLLQLAHREALSGRWHGWTALVPGARELVEGINGGVGPQLDSATAEHPLPNRPRKVLSRRRGQTERRQREERPLTATWKMIGTLSELHHHNRKHEGHDDATALAKNCEAPPKRVRPAR